MLSDDDDDVGDDDDEGTHDDDGDDDDADDDDGGGGNDDDHDLSSHHLNSLFSFLSLHPHLKGFIQMYVCVCINISKTIEMFLSIFRFLVENLTSNSCSSEPSSFKVALLKIIFDT